MAELGIDWRVRLIGCAATLLMAVPVAAASFSSPNNLVVLRLGTGTDYTPGKTQSLHLDEYNVGISPPALVQTLDLVSTGSSAVTLPDGGSHDGILNRSADGHYLVFGGYRVSIGANDPTSYLSDPSIPRVIVRVAANGTVDTSTVLTDGSFTQNTVRAVATDDGSRFWVGGDNANNEPANEANIKGGLRYVASLGASMSVNLSKVQVSGGLPNPDNVRNVGIFNGQLYESSGSDSSIGKAILQVDRKDMDPGLPTATMNEPQILNRLTTDGSSTSAFHFADLDPGVPGLDTLYASGSAEGPGIGLHKYAKVSCISGPTCYSDPGGGKFTWVGNGYVGLDFDTVEFEAVAIAVNGSTVSVYATDHQSIYRLTDSTGYNHTITGPITSILTAGADKSFRGLAFAPTPATVTGDYNGNGIVDAPDYTVWRDHLGQNVPMGTGADGSGNGLIDDSDYMVWKNNFGHPPGAGAGATVNSPVAVPEPATLTLAALGCLGLYGLASRRAK